MDAHEYEYKEKLRIARKIHEKNSVDLVSVGASIKSPAPEVAKTIKQKKHEKFLEHSEYLKEYRLKREQQFPGLNAEIQSKSYVRSLIRHHEEDLAFDDQRLEPEFIAGIFGRSLEELKISNVKRYKLKT